jgi:hypothetical protein
MGVIVPGEHDLIGVNAVSAYYYDHLFVPEQRADEALSLLRAMGSSVPDF